jgi:hypothetical protein
VPFSHLTVHVCSNGAFARPWSKTMVGYGPEDEEFVFELTFNYGIVKYEQGHGELETLNQCPLHTLILM